MVNDRCGVRALGVLWCLVEAAHGTLNRLKQIEVELKPGAENRSKCGHVRCTRCNGQPRRYPMSEARRAVDDEVPPEGRKKESNRRIPFTDYMSGAPSGDGLLVGYVAKVLSEREIAINIGQQDGVEEGMRFGVLTSEQEEIADPITGETLGVLDRTKARVEATQVFARMTVCATYETRVVGVVPGSDFFLEPMRRVPRTLRASKEAYPAPLLADDSYVKIGDRVKQLADLP